MNAVLDVTLLLGDCIEVMRTLPEASIDAIITDPPYGLGFMGKEWDNFAPQVVAARAQQRASQAPIRDGDRTRNREAAAWTAGEYDRSVIGNRAFQSWCEQWAREAYRVLKPGGHLLAFGGPRTYHRIASGIEDAGFEIRDSLMWLFGSGFPKSLDVSKAIDRANGDERPVIGEWDAPGRGQRAESQAYGLTNDHGTITSAASAASAAWDGWGTALKPAYEPIVLARKRLIGTVAANVLLHGTGALNTDGCRIGTQDTRHIKAGGVNDFPHEDDAWEPQPVEVGSAHGRWPANVLLDEEAAALLDAQTGELASGFMKAGTEREGIGYHGGPGTSVRNDTWGDSGGPSRFFYIARTSRGEREAGLDDIEPALRNDGGQADHDTPGLRRNERHNDHPTVKPVDLMRWLCRLVTPPGGLVLDPFLGSGTTAMAALDEHMRVIGIEREPRYLDIARARIEHRHLLASEVKPPSAQRSQGVLI